MEDKILAITTILYKGEVMASDVQQVNPDVLELKEGGMIFESQMQKLTTRVLKQTYNKAKEDAEKN